MNDLVTLHDGDLSTTSIIIAQGTGVQHKNILELVRQYISDLEEFGRIAFETRKSGGRPTEVAILNEPLL